MRDCPEKPRVSTVRPLTVLADACAVVALFVLPVLILHLPVAA